jgi:hypothetical protein
LRKIEENMRTNQPVNCSIRTHKKPGSTTNGAWKHGTTQIQHTIRVLGTWKLERKESLYMVDTADKAYDLEIDKGRNVGQKNKSF